MFTLNEIQSATIIELMNISICRAASSLNQLVDEEIRLTVPEIHFIERIEASQRIDACSPAGTCAVLQEFSGPCSGDALLFFPEEKSFELVRAIIGESASLESVIKMETDALTEVGNIVLNAALGSLANQLDMELSCALPEHLKGSGATIMGLDKATSGNGDLAMFMEVNFELQKRKISGYVVFVLDINSAKKFIDLIDSYISRVVM